MENCLNNIHFTLHILRHKQSHLNPCFLRKQQGIKKQVKKLKDEIKEINIEIYKIDKEINNFLFFNLIKFAKIYI